jgi:hypothetical protein
VTEEMVRAKTALTSSPAADRFGSSRSVRGGGCSAGSRSPASRGAHAQLQHLVLNFGMTFNK